MDYGGCFAAEGGGGGGGRGGVGLICEHVFRGHRGGWSGWVGGARCVRGREVCVKRMMGRGI